MRIDPELLSAIQEETGIEDVAWLQMALDAAVLVDRKNRAYGDSTWASAAAMRALWPNGIAPERYEEALIMIRDMDKNNRISQGDAAAFDESPWADKIGYAMLGLRASTPRQVSPESSGGTPTRIPLRQLLGPKGSEEEEEEEEEDE